MSGIDWEEKIEEVLGNRLECNENNSKHIEDVKIWLCCCWQCGMIEEMSDFGMLKDKVDDIAERMIREL